MSDDAADPVNDLANQPYLRLRCLELAVQLAEGEDLTSLDEIVVAARKFYYFAMPQADVQSER